jgi:hypothetical protein
MGFQIPDPLTPTPRWVEIDAWYYNASIDILPKNLIIQLGRTKNGDRILIPMFSLTAEQRKLHANSHLLK